jgi:hypothetical protein
MTPPTNGVTTVFKNLFSDQSFGPWVFRLLLLCGILWTQLTYVPRGTFDHFVQQSLREQEKKNEILAQIKETVARIDERQKMRLEKEGIYKP